MNIFDTVYRVERNGRVWLLHWKNRYDPTLLIALSAAGTGLQIAGTLQQGDEADQIARQRAQIDLDNAVAVEEAAEDQARARTERTRRLIATQKSTAAASGIRINVGAPLLIEAETRRIQAQETGFLMERAGAEATRLRTTAELERKGGRLAKKRARFAAIMQGLQGATSIAFLGIESGLFSGTPTIKTTPSFDTSAGFRGLPTHLGTSFA